MSQSVESTLSELVSIVIAPREKHSTLIESLHSLFASIPADVEVIACLPRLPESIQREAKAMMSARGCCQLEEFEPDLIPHRARALGASRVSTPWVIFADNDLSYEADWLHNLAAEMCNGGMDVLAPLIFIGPPTGETIHHAGGLLIIEERADGRIAVREQHRLMNQSVAEAGIEELLQSKEFELCDVAEFHCLAMRTELLGDTISLPPQLITREQQDLALQCRKQGLSVGFVPAARVTYLAHSEFTDDDLRYHAARWSEERAKISLDYMESKWRMDFDRHRVLYRWIEKHRRRPFKKRGPAWLEAAPGKLLGHYFSYRYGYPI